MQELFGQDSPKPELLSSELSIQESFSQYWTLFRLKADGNYRVQTLEAAQTFCHQYFSDAIDPAEILNQLIAHPDPHAQLCIRCYISKEIVQACTYLVRQYGEAYQFKRADLLPFVLDDDGRLFEVQNGVQRTHSQAKRHQPLSIEILQQFSPASGSLRNWVIRFVRQHPLLKQFLLEQGLLLLTEWAILNDLEGSRLEKILQDFYQLTVPEIQAAVLLLQSYHAVYRADRQQQRSGRKRCLEPTDEQLQRIADRLAQSPLQPRDAQPSPTAKTVLNQLKKLALQVRQYRIYLRGGPLRQGHQTLSLSDPDIAERLEYQWGKNQVSADEIDETDAQMASFLQVFRQEFATALEQALTQVVQHRLQKKPQKAEQFLQALEQLHCQHRSMGEIAPAIGLRRQDEVTRLLKLKEFRGDVRNLILHQLKTFMQEQGIRFMEPDRLAQVSQQIDTALLDRIDDVIAAAQKEASTVKSYIQPSLFTQTLCNYLYQIMEIS